MLLCPSMVPRLLLESRLFVLFLSLYPRSFGVLSLSLEFTTLTDGWTHALTECLGMNDTYHLRYLVSVE